MKQVVTLLVVSFVSASVCSAAFAEETQWQKDHPRRTEVNGRLANQNARIHNEVKDGQITKAQAGQLHAQDHAIRQEERTMSSTNGGHITKSEQNSLNQQENQVSHEIGK